MMRPVESHERLSGREYSDRIRRIEPTPDSTTRDFSYRIREADGNEHHRQSTNEQFGEDQYESEETNQKEPPDEAVVESPRDPSADESGSLDLTA